MFVTAPSALEGLHMGEQKGKKVNMMYTPSSVVLPCSRSELDHRRPYHRHDLSLEKNYHIMYMLLQILIFYCKLYFYIV